MRRFIIILASATSSLGLVFGPTAGAVAQPLRQDLNAALEQLGAATVREVASDIALPADSAEYNALGKNAVLQLTATSAHVGELPLRSAYVLVGDVRVPLHRVAVLPPESVTLTRAGRSETYTRQVAFYLMPIYLLTREAQLKVDFAGRRDEFGVSRFGGSALDGAPTFVRADDYPFPSEPDLAAIRRLITREFPH
jgi:hypothetical protein